MEQDANREQSEKKVLRAKDIIPSSARASHMENSVPQFDLAAEIMAQQRKITAAKRKRPGNGTPAPLERIKIKSPGLPVRIHSPQMSASDPVIAEIVARDIQRMLRINSVMEA